MQVPLGIRLNLLHQRMLSAVSNQGERAVSVRSGPHGFLIVVGDEKIHVPSPLRWDLYKKGWQARLESLACEYGIGTHFKLSPENTVIDIGANIGEFAHVCANAGAHVHCFEPDPDVFDCLRANTEGLANVFIDDALVWKTNGTVEIGLAPERGASSAFAETFTKVARPAVTLATYVTENNIPRIDLIKCDAQGAGPEVLLGAEPILHRVACVALDTGPERRGKRTNIRCKEILDDSGFEVSEEEIGGRLMTFAVNPLIEPQP